MPTPPATRSDHPQLPADMTALVVTGHGDRDVLRLERRPVPVPGPGQVLIEVAATGVNFVEVYQRRGVYPVPTPFVLGAECAGVVAATGPGVTLAVGTPVVTNEASGALAGWALARADRVVTVPAGLDLDLAAAVMLQGMTAHYLVTSTHPVQPGEAVLVHAAAGGVGQLLVQLALARGATVVATAGTAAKVALVQALGAHTVLRYDEVDDLAAAVREASGGGVHAAYDGVGAPTFDASMGSLRPRGVLALFGAAGGAVAPVDPQRLNAGGSLFLTRPTLRDYTLTREELAWRAGEVLTAVADGTLQVQIGGRYRLADAVQAYADLESRATTGKLLVLPQAG